MESVARIEKEHLWLSKEVQYKTFLPPGTMRSSSPGRRTELLPQVDETSACARYFCVT